MKAALLREFKKPLVIEETGSPTPGLGELLVKVEACGVCHSDLHLADGDWPPLRKILKLPLIPGHEVIGRVVATGEGVKGFRPGDRVGVPWIHWSCGECEMCAEGNENLCLAQIITGATVDGGYAELMCARASHSTRIPEALKSQEAAPLFCAGVTVYRAIKRSGIRPGERLAVFGVGGLGHLAVQIAVAFGAEVTAVDIAEEKLEFARRLGASHALHVQEIPSVRRSGTFKGMHAVIVTSAAVSAYESAQIFLRRTGRIMLVGAPSERISLTPISMLSGEYQVIASSVGTRTDLQEVLDLAASGKVRCRFKESPLDQINEVFEEMRRGAILGRAVLVF